MEKRVAHGFDLPTDKPVISPTTKSRLPLSLRQGAVEKLFDLLKIRLGSKEEAIQEALKQEATIYGASRQKQEYRTKFASHLLHIRNPEVRISKAPTAKQQQNLSLLRFDEVAGRIREGSMMLSRGLLETLGFPLIERISPIERLPGQEIDCCRCGKAFKPDTYYNGGTPSEACRYHHGRLRHERGVPHRIYSCCQGEAGSPACTSAQQHVYLSKSILEGEKVYASSQFPSLHQHQHQHHAILAIDGEMCHTTAGLELCRLTAVGWDEERVLDVLILPASPIVDYNTRFSGLSEGTFEEGGFPAAHLPEGLALRPYSLDELMTVVLPRIMSADTILLGHSLENDLLSMRLDHRKIIDTSVLYPHNKGPPYRMALRDLTRVHLQQFVQEGIDGHDSYEDCVACLRLFKLKL